MSEKPGTIVAAKEVDSTSAPHSKSSPERGFFPWLEEDLERDRKLAFTKMFRFPKLGAVGLLGSLGSCLLSLAVLLSFNENKVISSNHWPYFPKPSAWLSAIIAANGICLHMAVNKGVSITWWYRASKKETTVGDLHNVWDKGTSVFAAVTRWKSFDYIALATVLVASVPINGILLQNAISTADVDGLTRTPSVNFSIATNLPLGFSSDLDANGKPTGGNPYWLLFMPQIIANPRGIYETQSPVTTVAGLAVTKNLRGLGFRSSCENSTVPFNLPPDGKPLNSSTDNTILSIDVSWDWKSPYTIQLDTKYKQTPDCSGDLIVQNCSLELGTVQHSAQVEHVLRITPKNKEATETWQWTYVQPNSDVDDATFAPSPNWEPFTEQHTEFGTSNTTYGGFALAVASYFGGSITFETNDNVTELQYNGHYAIQQTPTFRQDDAGNTVALPNVCNASFENIDFIPPFFFHSSPYFDSPSDFMLDQIRTSLFYLSIQYSSAELNQIAFPGVIDANADTQTSVGIDDSVTISVYKVGWKWYFGSVAVTISIVLFILPTFYGFWTLARQTTLSPFETARAFHAPVLNDTAPDLDTPTLLKEVGKKNVHTDLLAPVKPNTT